jgi:hypothetical protein
MLLVLFSACSPTGSSGGSSLTVLQLLQNSSSAMSKLKSAHVDLKVNGTGEAVTNNATPTATATTTGVITNPTQTVSQVSYNVSGTGDEALPNAEEMQFTVAQTATNTTNNLAQIVLGDKVYVQNTKGQWYVLDKSALKGYVDNPFSGIQSPDLTEIIGLLEHTQITDNGDQMLNGQSLRHITIALDKTALKQFLSNNQQLIDILGQQNLNAIIDNTKTFSATVDLWIDEKTAYVHRTELKFNLSADTSSLGQYITPTTTAIMVPSNVTTQFDSIVDLSKFNESVNITPPTSAIPTNDPTTVFG